MHIFNANSLNQKQNMLKNMFVHQMAHAYCLEHVNVNIQLLKVLGKSVGGENAKVPRYEVKW